MRSVLGLAVATVTACGRLGFDAADGDDGSRHDAATDTGAMIDAPFVPWWDPAWQYRRAIRVDTSSITTELTGFPLPILLDATFDYSHARADGRDLRFVTGAGTVLAYDLDEWNAGNDAVLWVRVPSIAEPPDPPPDLWLYYGNPTAPGAVAPTTVWQDNVSVHHLASFTDSTGHGHTGKTETGELLPVTGAGIIGAAQSFDGNAALALTGEAAYDFTTMLSVSAWVRIVAVDYVSAGIICKGDSAWRLEHAATSTRVQFSTVTAGSNVNSLGELTAITAAAWHHIAFEYNGATKSIFVDGTLASSLGYTSTLNNNAFEVVLGDNEEPTPVLRFHGSIDEVRIAAQAHGAPWIAAEYRAVADPTFVVVGPSETAP